MTLSPALKMISTKMAKEAPNSNTVHQNHPRKKKIPSHKTTMRRVEKTNLRRVMKRKRVLRQLGPGNQALS